MVRFYFPVECEVKVECNLSFSNITLSPVSGNEASCCTVTAHVV